MVTVSSLQLGVGEEICECLVEGREPFVFDGDFNPIRGHSGFAIFERAAQTIYIPSMGHQQWNVSRNIEELGFLRGR